MLSSAIIGIDAYIVEVEVDISQGLPSFTTVGLPEASVKESRERVKSAIQNSGYSFPADRITVNLAPANIKKEGTGYDLPIALGILAATGIIPQTHLSGYCVLGELSLDGRVKPVKGSLPMAIGAKTNGHESVLVSVDNSLEASVVNQINVFAINSLAQAVGFLNREIHLSPVKTDSNRKFKTEAASDIDFSDIVGQENAKRALEIAAAGGHNVMMIGPPGSGKTMMARRLPTILPPLTFDEAIETTKIFSVAGLLAKDQALVTQRPFRSPHHTISDAGLIGGGHTPKPGEVSLAHNGVLFLDELPEYKKPVLEAMRQPLEDHQVTISRAVSTITYPASFMLVAAMNPCPCGYFGESTHPCQCSHHQVHRYRSRISGPLLDRIDLHVDVPAVNYKDLLSKTDGESGENIRFRVSAARQIQSDRFKRKKIHTNAQMESRQINSFCQVTPSSKVLLETAIVKLGLSARAYNRILKISRTIADLDDSPAIRTEHLSEAIQYRTLDRSKQYWP